MLKFEKPPLKMWILNSLAGSLVGAVNPILAIVILKPEFFSGLAERFGQTSFFWIKSYIGLFMLLLPLPGAVATAILYPFLYGALLSLAKESDSIRFQKILFHGFTFGAGCTAIVSAIILSILAISAFVQDPSVRAFLAVIASIPFSVVPAVAMIILCAPAICVAGYLFVWLNLRIIMQSGKGALYK